MSTSTIYIIQNGLLFQIIVSNETLITNRLQRRVKNASKCNFITILSSLLSWNVSVCKRICTPEKRG